MRAIIGLLFLVTVLMVGCVVEPAGYSGVSVGVYGEYPYRYYGHGGYYGYHRYYYPYDRDHYYYRHYRPYRYWY